jgi:protein-disulfide isomerase
VWKLYPEQYFPWREAMFHAQDAEGSGFGNIASIDKLTATISGIDAAKVAADVSANKSAYDTLIARDKAEAAKIDVRSTPSVVIGKKAIAGAYDYATFKAAIDAEL